MNIPFVLDIAIGLIFVYLILSLLASEIQELITTVLQWRAEHLKKSIEVLLGGKEESKQTREARQLANELYNHPLIKDLNQEAKGVLARGVRQVGQRLFAAYQKLTKSENTFGSEKSGPSYIPPDFFAVTLMDKLGIRGLSHVLSIGRIEDFKQGQLKDLIGLGKNANLSETEYQIFQEELTTCGQALDQLVLDYAKEEITLPMFVDLMEERLVLFVEELEVALAQAGKLPDSAAFLLRRIRGIRKQVYGEAGKQVLLKNLKPRPSDVVDSISSYREVYGELQKIFEDKDSPVYQQIEATFKELEKAKELLPDSLKESLSVLAKRAQSKSDGVGDEINSFQKEIETWFDGSMERASGVYRRNARGVAILVGFLVAISANSDTLHIINSLSKDPIVRGTVTMNAESLVRQNPTIAAQELEEVKTQVKQSLEDVSLPIGWNQANLRQQAIAQKGWGIPYLKRIVGWLISGIAISMGASFWFDLLSKVVNVRNVGKGSYSRLDEPPNRRV